MGHDNDDDEDSVRRVADLGLGRDCRRPCTRALFGAETLEIEIEMEMEIELEMEMENFEIFGEDYFLSLLNGADLGEGAKLGEALLNNGPPRPRPRGCRLSTARKGQGAFLAVVHHANDAHGPAEAQTTPEPTTPTATTPTATTLTTTTTLDYHDTHDTHDTYDHHHD